MRESVRARCRSVILGALGLTVVLVVALSACSSDPSLAPSDGSTKKDLAADAARDALVVDGTLQQDGKPAGDGKPVGDGKPPLGDGKPAGDGKPVADLAVAQCSGHCDCPQGADCLNKHCVQTVIPAYCCDNPGCPIGLTCKDQSGKLGTCPTVPLCQTRCDCTQGFDCVGGKCIVGTKAVYCCDKLGCPLNQACVDSAGKPGTCGTTTTACKVACDCPKQGQACLANKCVQLVTQLYCCAKAGCPNNAVCQRTNGTFGLCGGSTHPCAVHCDCNQGLSCVNGTCLPGTKATYCCSKAGCPKNQACYDLQNAPGVCP